MAEALGLGAGASNANVAKIAIEQSKKKTDVVEPQVISEDLLVAGAVEPVRPDGEPWDPIDFPQVTSLRLSFLNIIEISNLNNFDSLTTLRLDNNIIDRIANLNHLKQLTWLDLSFNNIRDIEGLDNLSNLLDLSLYHNQIEKIEGLDGCPQLNILSLGHNHIKDLRQIDNLRKFQNLRCVCLDGNKVCQHDTYTQHVLAYLPMLKYLDYMLIDRKAVTQAQEYGVDELLELKEREQAEAAKERARKDKEAVMEKLKASFLDVTEDLFEDLFSKEAEPEHLTVLQCYWQLKEDMRDKLTEDIKTLRQWMEERNEVRMKKVASFEKAISTAEKESEEEAFLLVRDFRSLKKKVLAQLDREDGAQRPESEAIVEELQRQLGKLENQLMANEIQLQESIEEAITDFEAKIENMVKLMADKGREFFTRLEDLERSFFLGLTEGMTAEVEAFAQNQEMTNMDTDTNKAKYLGNGADMTLAATNFNEAHMSLIQNKDDSMQATMTSWRNTFFEGHRERQYHRNRQRIIDCKKVVDDCRAEILAAAVEAGDEYDDHENGGEIPYGR